MSQSPTVSGIQIKEKGTVKMLPKNWLKWWDYTCFLFPFDIYVATDRCLSIDQWNLENVSQALFWVSWCHSSYEGDTSYGGWNLRQENNHGCLFS